MVLAAGFLTGCSGAKQASVDRVALGSENPNSALSFQELDAQSLPELAVISDSYQVPAPLAYGKPGAPIAVERLEQSEHISNARATRFLYHSTDRNGDDVAVSAVMYVPEGIAPEGGWPVLAWGHGTTGVADRCAPSLTDNLFYNEYAQQANYFIAAGYAVVATDYMGLGTPGMHAYLHGPEEGSAMVDSVAAARQLEGALSNRWFAIGHSQGGQAALFAGKVALRAPELELLGIVSIAPSSTSELAIPGIVAGLAPKDTVYGLYMLASLEAVDPSVSMASELGPAGLARLDLILQDGCLLEGLAELGDVSVDEIFMMTPDRATALSAKLAEYADAESSMVPGPILVVQGEADEDVPPAFTQNLVDKLTALGADIEFRTYPGLDHDRVLGPSVCETLRWMHLHGGRPAEQCQPEPTDMS